MKNTPKVIVVTGNIGTGKTTVMNYLDDQLPGFIHITYMDILIALLRENKQIKNKIVWHFGHLVLDKNDKIDRHYLAHIVFKFIKADQILYNIIRTKVKKIIKQQINSDCDYVLIEDALFYDRDIFKEIKVDFVIHMTSDQNKQIQRVKKRDRREESQIQNILNLQQDSWNKFLSLTGIEKINIHNSGSKKELLSQIDKVIKHLSCQQSV